MATVEQMCRQNGPHWIIAQDGEPELRAMYERHYSCYHYKDGRRPKKFCGPGQIIPLTLPNRDALFVWRKFRDDSGQTGINCAVFRNESHYLSSDLIREADAIADFCWPCERHYTYVRAERLYNLGIQGIVSYAPDGSIAVTPKQGCLSLNERREK